MFGWKTGIPDTEKGHEDNQDIDGWIQFNIESFGSLYLHMTSLWLFSYYFSLSCFLRILSCFTN